MVLTDTITR